MELGNNSYEFNNDLSFTGNVEPAPQEIGTPQEDSMFAPGPQERIDSCAIRSQQHILSMFGIDIPEADLVKDAIAHREYSVMNNYGTSLDDVGNILERNGIDTHRYTGATIVHLISELGQGHKIIVGVDANEIVADTPESRMVEMQKDLIEEVPNHALVVVNVDPVTFDVDVVDPSDGHMHRVPANIFLDAWKDSDCFMVSTAQSPEEFAEYSLEAGNNRNGGIIMNEMGQIGMHAVDIDNDGIADVFEQDLDMDGRLETLMVDTNHDGIPDVVIHSTPGLVNTGNPGLGGLGHAAGIVSQEPSLGGLGHVSGLPQDAALGGLGHAAGIVSQEPSLGSLGHVSGLPQDAALGGLGHAAGIVPQEPSLGSLGHGGTVGGSDHELAGMDLSLVDLIEKNDALIATFDMDGDMIPDALAIDVNKDGSIDAIGQMIDIDGDGIPDVVGIDIDGDGIIDGIVNLTDL